MSRILQGRPSEVPLERVHHQISPVHVCCKLFLCDRSRLIEFRCRSDRAAAPGLSRKLI